MVNKPKTTEEDDFDKYFTERVGEDATATEETEETPPPDTTEETPTEETPVEETPVGATIQPTDQTPATPPQIPPIPAEPTPAPADREATYLAEVERLKAQTPPETPSEGTKQETPAEETFSISEFFKNDPDILEFYREYPELAKPQEKMLTLALSKVVDVVTQELAKRDSALTQLLQPILDDIGNSKRQSHVSAIRQAHPDVDDLLASGAIQKWIQSQPKYLQDALNKVYAEGSVEDVIDLLNQFKKSSAPPQTPPPSPPQQEVKQENLDKLKSMEAVGRKTAAEPKLSKALDFDEAFEEAVRALSNR